MNEPNRYDIMFSNAVAHFNNLLFSLAEDKRLVEAAEHQHQQALDTHDESLRDYTENELLPTEPEPEMDFEAFYSAHDEAVALLDEAKTKIEAAHKAMQAVG